MRGWSYAGTSANSFSPLFPAHAGVILEDLRGDCEALAIPRPCGGDPNLVGYTDIREDYSPLMQGIPVMKLT